MSCDGDVRIVVLGKSEVNMDLKNLYFNDIKIVSV